MKKVIKYIEQHQLLQPNDKVIVAISGGADSVALLDILHNAGYRCIAAHCNFCLRGEESLEDERFVRELCDRKGIKLFVKSFQTEEYAQTNGISIEMAARELRYRWFEELRLMENCQAIAVAHHKNDQAETVLLNLRRGTGIRGLEGMHPRNGYVIRPLLSLTKAEIIAYIQIHKLRFREDSTNTDTRFRRNAIRCQLKDYSASDIEHIVQLSERMCGYEQIIDDYISTLGLKENTDKSDIIRINIEKLLNTAAPQTILYELLRPYSFTQTNEIFHSLNRQSGKQFFSPTHVALKDRNYLIIRPCKMCEDGNLVVKYTIRNKNPQEIYPLPNERKALFDAKITLKKLSLRHWHEGDFFCPIGMHGKRKLLSDFFTDQHLTLIEKEQVWLLCADNDIAWIVGYRLDDRYKITEQTTRVAEITIER